MRRAYFSVTRIALLLLVAACAAAPSCQIADPIQRALDFLAAQQVKEFTVIERPYGRRMMDFPGNWPQEVFIGSFPTRPYRDVSPFMPAFIHHALTYVREGNLEALGLPPESAQTARQMRKDALAFMRTFESPAGEPDAGTFGFWPYDSEPDRDATLEEFFFLAVLGGPRLKGPRVPVNIASFPREMGIPTDADVTASVYLAILNDAHYDGGLGANVDFDAFFSDWRDRGQVVRRIDPPWLPPRSGAFLTWLNYADVPSFTTPNDLDAVVNANVLHALGILGRLDSAGVDDAIDFINLVVENNLHSTNLAEAATYYPDNLAFHYCVSRAYQEGGVTGLRPSVELLADELEAEALVDVPGRAYWDRGAPDLNTAFAILTLMNAGRETPLIEEGAAFLRDSQNPFTGAWKDSVFFVARTDSGLSVSWTSPSLTTAIAMEALCRYRLLTATR